MLGVGPREPQPVKPPQQFVFTWALWRTGWCGGGSGPRHLINNQPTYMLDVSYVPNGAKRHVRHDHVHGGPGTLAYKLARVGKQLLASSINMHQIKCHLWLTWMTPCTWLTSRPHPKPGRLASDA